MKNNYMSNVDAILIQKEGFMPFINKEGQRIQYDGVKIVKKVMNDKLIIVEMLDADCMTEGQIKNKLEMSAKSLSQMGASTVIAFQVFVFDSIPDDKKVQLIREGQMEDVYIKKYLPCITVDLTNKQVNKLYNLPIKVQGIEEVLNSVLDMDNSESILSDNNENSVLKAEKEFNHPSVRFADKVPFITYGLIVINVLVWLVMNIYALVKDTSVQSLFIPFGAKENSLIFAGEYWRFLTPIFLHADLEHLIMNCLSLFVFGRIVEGIYGHKKFAFIYFFAGIMGGIASFMFSPHSAVGASGAIFGLMGALFYFSVENPVLFKKYFGNSILIMVIVNLVYGFIRPGIDNYGHIGGLIGGFLASGIVKITKSRKKVLSRPVFIVLTVLVLSGSLYYGFNMSGNAKYYEFEELIQENKLEDAEKKAEEIFNMSLANSDLKADTLISIAMLECFQGKYDEAIEKANYLKELDASKGHYLLGIIYINEQKYELAEKELKTAVKIDPNLKENVDSLLEKIEIYVR